ncbi:MAG: NAD-dependent epimerase/dehydratase family protein [Paludibacter sp.]|nr:NAD-dependent epimerase/dehydratase family protein [Paludibacter sp.]MDD4199649.1 NAD-dependent epimerase/dehydratase family protein [Paludibacter sp.]MDD4429156.1 NAD-dependent epimerase/dehydratase family protein [Paludibacter sp.]
MRYFVTGCTGFIGIHLCRLLISEGHEVYGLVRNPGKIPSDLRGKLKVVEGGLDIFEHADLVLPEVDIVVHLAGIITGRNRTDYLHVNYEAMVHLVDALNRQFWRPMRFILASSLAAAGPNRDEHPLCESDEATPIEPYGLAKLKSEQFLRLQSFPVTIFRPPAVVGPGDPAMLTLFNIVKRGVGLLPSGNPQLLSFIYVGDLVEAIYIMSKEQSDSNKLYFVTSEERVTNRDIVNEIAVSLQKKILIIRIPKCLVWLLMAVSTAISNLFRTRNFYDYRQYKQMTTPAFVCTSELLTAETGWKAKTGLAEAIRLSAEGYKEMNWL